MAGLLAEPGPPREIQAIEIQESHYQAARAALAAAAARTASQVRITRADLFELDLGRDLDLARARSAARRRQSALGHQLRAGKPGEQPTPAPANLKGLRGLEARTGSSNFDVTEAIWLKLAFELARSATDDRALVQDVGGARASSSSPTAPACRLRPRRFAGSTRPAGSARPSTRACSASPDARHAFRSGRQGGRRSSLPSQRRSACKVPVYRRRWSATPNPDDDHGLRPRLAGRRSTKRIDAWSFADGVCPLDLAARAQARRRGGDGADPRPGLGPVAQPRRRSRSTSSRNSSIRWSRGPT